MKLVFSLFYSKFEDDFGHWDGGTTYGNRLLAPIIMLHNKLEQAGHNVLTSRECSLENADVAIFWDLDERSYKKVISLPKHIPCVLISNESPIYSPLSHRSNILFLKRWSAVMTWNRAYASDHIYYYDIPFAGASSSEEISLESENPRGVVVSSYKKDPRGLTHERDALFEQLARERYLDIYGMNWRRNEKNGIFGSSPHKIRTMSNYEYAVISENSLYAGYVTEKIADAIIAGIPSIYFGDISTAKRRFPGTFIPLEELSRESFLKSRELLYRGYEILSENVKKCRSESGSWSDSFIDTFLLMLDNIEK